MNAGCKTIYPTPNSRRDGSSVTTELAPQEAKSLLIDDLDHDAVYFSLDRNTSADDSTRLAESARESFDARRLAFDKDAAPIENFAGSQLIFFTRKMNSILDKRRRDKAVQIVVPSLSLIGRKEFEFAPM